MNKIKAFTKGEREKYSKPYVHFIMQGEELKSLHSEEECEKRYFIKKVDILKRYLDALDEADYKASGEGFFELFKSDNQYKEEVLRLKDTLGRQLEKLVHCQECECIKCLRECPFDACHYCQSGTLVKSCDKERYVITSGYGPISLYSHDEKRDVWFEVIGILKDRMSTKRYIYLVESKKRDNQHILEYCKYVNGDVDYLPLDEETLDKIYTLFVKLDCYE